MRRRSRDRRCFLDRCGVNPRRAGVRHRDAGASVDEQHVGRVLGADALLELEEERHAVTPLGVEQRVPVAAREVLGVLRRRSAARRHEVNRRGLAALLAHVDHVARERVGEAIEGDELVEKIDEAELDDERLAIREQMEFVV